MGTKTYKVWVHVEEIDEENDSYTDDFPGSCLPMPMGEFNTFEEAYKMVNKISLVEI
jgi:hypothetical protein